MRAAIFEQFGGPVSVENLPDPVARPGGVVIEVKANGICRSDWHGWMGHDDTIALPHVPGHECAGVVAAVDSTVAKWKVGDRVIVPFSCGCGSCDSCAAGFQNICDREFQPGFTSWGSFAEFVAVDYADENLVALPQEIDFTTAASLGCRFMTAFRGLTERAVVRDGESVVVFGCGGVGLSAVLIAKAFGAYVVAVDIRQSSLDMATSIGADATFNASDRTAKQVDEAVRDLTDGGAHVSIDALGSPVTAQNSIRCLRKRGRHIQIGLAAGDSESFEIPMNLVIARELDLLGSHGMQAHKYPLLLSMIENGQIDPTVLVGNLVGLSQGAAILTTMNDDPPVGITVINDFLK